MQWAQNIMLASNSVPMKHLVLNADDFGLDPAVNAAVAQAHIEGILTSASLLIAAPYAKPAIAIAKANPSLGVGLHLCLVQGRPAAPHEKISALVNGDGELPSSPFSLSAQLTFSNRVKADVEAELRAQIDCFLATGLQPTHLDAHLDMHLHPRVLEIVAALAHEHQISCVRAPVEPLRQSLRSSRERLPRKLARWTVFGSLGARAKRQLRQMGLDTADRAVGVLDPGHMIESFLAAYLLDLPEAVTEIIFHPASECSASLEKLQRGYQHVEELRALCSLRLHGLIERLGIHLTNFRELAPRTGFR